MAVAEGRCRPRRDRLGKTALMRAAGGEDRDGDDFVILRHLLAKGADPNVADASGRTALMTAAGYGNHRAVDALLRAGADAEMEDDAGRTALAYAAANGHADTIRLLDIGAAARPGGIG